jgi:F-type H+-transporting ATPase subunit c
MKKINLAALSVAMMPAVAFAQEHAAVAATGDSFKVAAYWGAALCIGVAASVVGFSQSRAAVAALEGIGRNPSAAKLYTTPLILSLALMEALGLLAFVIAILLLGK